MTASGCSSSASGQKVMALSLHDLLRGPPSQVKSPSQEKSSTQEKRPTFRPYHARRVPKNEKLDEIGRTDVPVTTMMLRNIPNKYTQSDLLEEIDAAGFAGTYDFAYLPMDIQNHTNVSYAFINFVADAHASRFHGTFSERRFQTHQSRKISGVSAAHMQGLDANVLHFATKAVTHSKKSLYRPVIVRGGKHLDFDEAVAEVTARNAAPKALLSPSCSTSSPRSWQDGMSVESSTRSPTRSPTLSPSEYSPMSNVPLLVKPSTLQVGHVAPPPGLSLGLLCLDAPPLEVLQAGQLSLMAEQEGLLSEFSLAPSGFAGVPSYCPAYVKPRSFHPASSLFLECVERDLGATGEPAQRALFLDAVFEI